MCVCVCACVYVLVCVTLGRLLDNPGLFSLPADVVYVS